MALNIDPQTGLKRVLSQIAKNKQKTKIISAFTSFFFKVSNHKNLNHYKREYQLKYVKLRPTQDFILLILFIKMFTLSKNHLSRS